MYQYPSTCEIKITLKERMETEEEGHKPVKHENTGIDEEEALYESYLMPVGDAVEKLGRSVQADVVKKG